MSNSGEGKPALTVTARYGFEAAHRLEDASCSDKENAEKFGMCNRLHGHNYQLAVTVSGAADDPAELGGAMVVDFGDLDRAVEEHVLSVVEHQYLNDLPGLSDRPTTAETVVAWVWSRLEPALDGMDVVLERLVINESDRYAAELQRRT